MKRSIQIKRSAPVVLFLALIALVPAINVYLLRLNVPEIPSIAIDPSLSAAESLSAVDRVVLDNFKSFASSPASRDIFAQASGTLRLEAPLYVDRCEVSQGAFYAFAAWIRKQEDAERFFDANQPADHRFRSSSIKSRILGQESAPANGVNFYDATVYCRASGGRLPTAAEWNAAAGSEVYPWGNSMNFAPWSFSDVKLNIAAACGTHPDADTPSGLNAMGSGVSEWTRANTSGGKPGISGGNGYSKPYALHAMSFTRREHNPLHRSPITGFRCVYDSQPVATTPWEAAIEVRKLHSGNYAYGVPPKTLFARLLPHLDAENQAEIQRWFRDLATPKTDHFRLSIHEINVQQYQTFLRDPLVRLGFFANDAEPAHTSYTPEDWTAQQQHPLHPVRGVDWWSAYAFAQWAGGALPTAEEWERAFAPASLYPWGLDYQGSLALTEESGRAAPVDGADFSADTTPLGARHMGGNVSEWTSSIVSGNSGFEMVVKGGSFRLPGRETSRKTFYRTVPTEYRSDNIGFRVLFATKEVK